MGYAPYTQHSGRDADGETATFLAKNHSFAHNYSFHHGLKAIKRVVHTKHVAVLSRDTQRTVHRPTPRTCWTPGRRVLAPWAGLWRVARDCRSFGTWRLAHSSPPHPRDSTHFGAASGYASERISAPLSSSLRSACGAPQSCAWSASASSGYSSPSAAPGGAVPWAVPEEPG